jgi:hypothetical protein
MFCVDMHTGGWRVLSKLGARRRLTKLSAVPRRLSTSLANTTLKLLTDLATLQNAPQQTDAKARIRYTLEASGPSQKELSAMQRAVLQERVRDINGIRYVFYALVNNEAVAR